MFRNLYCATVYVNDQDKALDFYLNTLGWETVDDTMMGASRWLVVKPKGAETGVALLGSDWEGPDGAPVKVGGPTGISLVAGDLQALYDDLSSKGVTFEGEPEPMPFGGKGVTFSDPDGNSFFVAGE